MLCVPVRQCQRDQLAFIPSQHPYKLPGAGRLCDERCIHHELDDTFRQFDFLQDFFRRLALFGIAFGTGHQGFDFTEGEWDIAGDLPCRCLAVSRRLDRGGTAAVGIATGIDVLDRGFLGAGLDLDGAPFAGFESRLRVLDDGVGRITQGHNHEIYRDILGLSGCQRPPPARGIRFTQFHHIEKCMGDKVVLVVAGKLAGRAQYFQIDILFQGMMQFLHTCRHFILGAAVNDGDLAAEAPGSAGGIHRGVATADDDDLLAFCFRQRRLIFFLVRLHQVDASEKFIRRQDAVHVLTRNVHEARQSCTGTDKDLPEAGPFQRLQGGGFTHDKVGDKLAAHLVDLHDDVVNQIIGQTKLGNTVAQHTAEFVEGLENSDRVTFL